MTLQRSNSRMLILIMYLMLNHVDAYGRVYSRRCVADGSKSIHLREVTLFTCRPHPLHGEQLIDFASCWPTID